MQTESQYKQRDEKLVNEFYQMYSVRRMNLNDTLTELSKQFCLDSSYIYRRVFDIKENSDLYSQLAMRNITGKPGSAKYSNVSSKTFEQLQDECPEELSRMAEQDPDKFRSLFNSYLIENELKYAKY